MNDTREPHAGTRVAAVGAPLERGPGEGHAVVIAIHGRNAAPENILDLVPRLAVPDVTYLAPAASAGTWYPLSFLADRDRNEPYLSSALRRVRTLVEDVVAAGVARSQIVLLGFSQGACLACEFVYRHPARYGGLVAFSGGLIGPPGTSWSAASGLEGTPAFLGCSDVDGHVPAVRVEESAEALTRAGADVTLRFYPGMGHLVNDDEIAYARAVIASAASGRAVAGLRS
jgi:phospholipase/carboxylesterase